MKPSPYLKALIKTNSSPFIEQILDIREAMEHSIPTDLLFCKEYLDEASDQGFLLPLSWEQYDDAQMKDLAAFVWVARSKIEPMATGINTIH